jgi:hypothetical protein
MRQAISMVDKVLPPCSSLMSSNFFYSRDFCSGWYSAIERSVLVTSAFVHYPRDNSHRWSRCGLTWKRIYSSISLYALLDNDCGRSTTTISNAIDSCLTYHSCVGHVVLRPCRRHLRCWIGSRISGCRGLVLSRQLSTSFAWGREPCFCFLSYIYLRSTNSKFCSQL